MIAFIGLVALAAAGSAPAAWHRASSKHIVIYADRNPSDLRAFAIKLEKFDKAVRLVRGMQDLPVGDGNRLSVFVVGSQADVGRLARDKTGFTAGFYSGRAVGSLAVVPRSIGDGTVDSMTSDVVFFHEYAHHLMLSEVNRPIPLWLSEGFAEFMSTATVERDGGVQLGRAPQFRAQGLMAPLPVAKLLTSGRVALEDGEQLYGTSWLLTHYLNFEPSRQGQIETYVAGITRGADSLTAARAAFGDLKKLDRELSDYLAKSRIAAIKVKAAAIGEPVVAVEPLTAGAAAVMRDRIQSKVGVDRSTAEPLAVRVRAIQSRFTGDPLVERTLAEAEVDAGHYAAAEAAADRPLKADPQSTEALIYKGRAIMAGSRIDRMAEARRWFQAANKIDPEDPEPLMLFYRTFAAPTANAVAALHYASDLAPQDASLRISSAMQYLRDGKVGEARDDLVALAYDPHGGTLSETARTMIQQIDAGQSQAIIESLAGKDQEQASIPPAR